MSNFGENCDIILSKERGENMIFSLTKEGFLPNVRRIGFCNYLKNWTHFPRITNEYIFFLVIEGDLYLDEDSSRYHLKAGDYLLLEPNKRHVGYKGAKVKYFYFHFHESTLIKKVQDESEILLSKLIECRRNSLSSDPFLRSNKLNTMDIIFPKYFTIKNQSALINISSTFNSAVEEVYKKYENYKLYTSTIVLEILILISREYTTSLYEHTAMPDTSSKVTLYLKKLIDFIHKNYQKKLNIKSIEAYMGLNYDYLNELLKKNYKTTIGKYIQNTRINSAKKLIQETDLNFSEIAYLVGINDPYYFSKLFKSITGLTPTKYANLIKYEQQETLNTKEKL